MPKDTFSTDPEHSPEKTHEACTEAIRKFHNRMVDDGHLSTVVAISISLTGREVGITTTSSPESGLAIGLALFPFLLEQYDDDIRESIQRETDRYAALWRESAGQRGLHREFGCERSDGPNVDDGSSGDHGGGGETNQDQQDSSGEGS